MLAKWLLNRYGRIIGYNEKTSSSIRVTGIVSLEIFDSDGILDNRWLTIIFPCRNKLDQTSLFEIILIICFIDIPRFFRSGMEMIMVNETSLINFDDFFSIERWSKKMLRLRILHREEIFLGDLSRFSILRWFRVSFQFFQEIEQQSLRISL